MVEILYEVVLPRRPLPQPVPSVVEGGDCSACVLGGLLGVSVEETYERFEGPTASAPNRFELEGTLLRFLHEGCLDRVVAGVPLWNTESHLLAFGPSGHLSFSEWFEYVRMGIDGGYYGIASVDFHRRGAREALPPETNHVVLLCGVREVCVPHETLAVSRIDQEVLVSCSARSSPDLEWVEVKEFLAKRGGYNVILVRPTS